MNLSKLKRARQKRNAETAEKMARFRTEFVMFHHRADRLNRELLRLADDSKRLSENLKEVLDFTRENYQWP